MEQHTLVFDMELAEEDIAQYEQCAGVVGVAAYGNVLNLYYAHPVGRHETISLAEAVLMHAHAGMHLVDVTREQTL